jgi:predicted transglutaminase-like cysteine proteinase
MTLATRSGPSLRPASTGQPAPSRPEEGRPDVAQNETTTETHDEAAPAPQAEFTPIRSLSPGDLVLETPDLSNLRFAADDERPRPFPAPRPLLAQEPQEVLAMSPTLWSTLTRVDRDINQRIRPASDLQAFGVDNFWDLPLGPNGRGMGNCKHYALEKRRALVEAGVPSRALYLAIVRTRWGEIHSVLVVATDEGDYVLDNLSPWVTPWQEAGYTWLARQVPGKPLEWAAPMTEAPARPARAFTIAAN